MNTRVLREHSAGFGRIDIVSEHHAVEHCQQKTILLRRMHASMRIFESGKMFFEEFGGAASLLPVLVQSFQAGELDLRDGGG